MSGRKTGPMWEAQRNLLVKIRLGAPLGSPEREDILVKALEAIDFFAEYPNRAKGKRELGIIQGALSKMLPRGSDVQTVIEAASKARKGKDE
jgi:hypothetical protein